MRRMVVCICLAGILCALTGCGDKKEAQGGNKTKSPATQQAESRTSKQTEQGTGDGETGERTQGIGTIKVLCNTDSVNAQNCINENGYYYIPEDSFERKDKNGAYGHHLMYMDFATQKEVYLCSTAGCKHNTAACTAVLAEEDFPADYLVFLQGDNLYLLSKEYDDDGQTSMNMIGEEEKEPEKTRAVLYRMKLDGSDRQKVYEFEQDLILENMVLEIGGDLGFVVKKNETKQLKKKKATYVVSSERRLVTLDTSSWEMKTVYHFEKKDTDTDWTIEGCFDSSLVLSNIVYDHVLTQQEEMDDDAYMDSFKKSKAQVAVLDLSNGSLEIQYTRSNKSKRSSDYVQRDEWLYVSEENKPEVKQINLKTGKSSTLAKLENSNIWCVFQDMVCCRSWDLMSDETLYFINRKSGKIRHSKLTNQSLGWVLEFRGELKDQFLVVHDYDATAQGDGSYEINRYYHALIDKEDLYSGKAQYRPIKMVEKGE